MKNLILGLVVFATTLVSAQEHLPNKSDYAAFFGTKTFIVLDNNPMSDYNFKIKDIIKKNWTLTEYEFIPYSEFENKRRDPSYSFLIVTTVTFDKDKTKARYNFLSLLLGKDVIHENDMPDLCSVPLSYLRVDQESYVYKIDAFVRFVQDHVTLMHKDPSLIKANAMKYYNKNVKSLQGKTLLLVKEDLNNDIQDIKKIKKIYKNNVKLVSKEEVMSAIERKDPNVVFLHKVGPEGTKYKARCYKIVIGAADSRFYYFDYHMVTPKNRDGLMANDLKKMAN